MMDGGDLVLVGDDGDVLVLVLDDGDVLVGLGGAGVLAPDV